ncbi:MAG: rhodanese-like domain-containing protein [Desulfobacterales bacterium]
MRNTIVIVIAVSAFVGCLFIVAPAKSEENHSTQFKTSGRYPNVLSMNDTAGKGLAIGIDARHLLRLMEMDPNLYVLYIGSGAEFERWFDGSKKAVHTSLNQIKENTLKISKDRTLVLICPFGQQSPVAAKILSARGYVVYYVVGGMKALNKLKKQRPHRENEKKTIRQKKNERHQPESIFNEEEDMGC